LVSIAYVVWPLALYEIVAPRPESSSWYRFHMRQALWFGVISAAIGLAALFWPLAATFAINGVAVMIWVYAFAMIVDLALLVLWLVVAARYSRRAANGELFDVPWVVRLTGASSHKR
jgi:uncharacterized Tic20 family protein